MTQSSKRAVILGIAVLAAFLEACSEIAPSAPLDARNNVVGPIVVSDTYNLVGAAARSDKAIVYATDASNASVSFLALQPGTIPNGTSAVIQNRRTASGESTVLVDGGFDPISVQAQPGDTLAITISMTDGEDSALVSVVPARRRPAVVRTIPARGKKDVPLNSRLTIVFSEPIDPGTITSQTIRVLRGQQEVSGKLTVSDHGLRVDFEPDAPLAAQSDYAVTISNSIADSDGDGLERSVETSFTTMQAGAIQVVVATGGYNQDADGYNVAVARDLTAAQAAAGMAVEANGSVIVTGLLYGEYVVLLRGIAGNCSVSANNPKTATLPTGGSVSVAFDVNCGGPQLAYAATVSGYPEQTGDFYSNTDIYITKPSGGVTRLTTDPAIDDEPAWSPDASRIAFRSERDGNGEIYVMQADGTAPTRLTIHPSADYQPAWSPDGSRMAFVSDRDGNAEIYVMNADGANVSRITNHTAGDKSPAWSPDGSKIAFSSDRDGKSHVYLINADGSNIVQLTDGEDADADPAWSPDGSRIALSRFVRSTPCVPVDSIDTGTDLLGYERMCRQDIVVMNSDGSGIVRLDLPTAPVPRLPDGWWRSVFVAKGPTWAPDGQQIAMGVFYCLSDFGGADCHSRSALIFLSPSGTGGFLELTTGLLAIDYRYGIVEFNPAWRP